MKKRKIGDKTPNIFGAKYRGPTPLHAHTQSKTKDAFTLFSYFAVNEGYNINDDYGC